MKYITATPDMADVIYNVLHTTIKAVYPKYYPEEVAEFFCQHHSKEHILEGIASGNMGVLVLFRSMRWERSTNRWGGHGVAVPPTSSLTKISAML